MKISVVVPSYNTAATIGATLAGLTQQEDAPPFEIIVVDCSESDAVANIVKGFPQVRFEHPGVKLGPGPNRNHGARMAHGELIVFVDADVVLKPNAIAHCWQHYHDGCKVFGGALELHEPRSVGVSSYLEHYFFNHESQEMRPRGTRQNLSSAFMCIDRALFFKFNGFKDIPRMEDTELTERLQQNGYALHFMPDMVALQIQDSPFKNVLRKIYLNGHNLYFIRYKASITMLRKLTFGLGLPVITAAKMARILVRQLRYNCWRKRAVTVALAPVLMLGGLYWMLGFYGAIIRDGGISAER